MAQSMIKRLMFSLYSGSRTMITYEKTYDYNSSGIFWGLLTMMALAVLAVVVKEAEPWAFYVFLVMAIVVGMITIIKGLFDIGTAYENWKSQRSQNQKDK